MTSEKTPRRGKAPPQLSAAWANARVALWSGPSTPAASLSCPVPFRYTASGANSGADFAFIDADKEEYADYYERTLELLRPGGLVCVDNVLWSGKVVDPAVSDADTLAIRAFNEKLADDARISLSLLSIADGLTLARKR